MTSRLQERYTAEIAPALQKQFEYSNPMQVPRLSKIVVNIGLGEALTNAKAIDAAARATSRSSPARSRSSPRPSARSPSSACGRATRSGPR